MTVWWRWTALAATASTPDECFAHFGSAARVQHAPVDDQFTLLLRVRYLQTSHFRPVGPGDVDETRVANLAPHLGVACGAIHNQSNSSARLRGGDRFDDCLGFKKS